MSVEFLHHLATVKAVPNDYEATTGHLITCLAVAGGAVDPDCPCAAASLSPPEGPEYTPCACGHIEPEHEPNAGACLSCDCEAYRPVPPAPLLRSADSCPGFPEACPNLRPVDPDPPRHLGGIRCGCADEERS